MIDVRMTECSELSPAIVGRVASLEAQYVRSDPGPSGIGKGGRA